VKKYIGDTKDYTTAVTDCTTVYNYRTIGLKVCITALQNYTATAKDCTIFDKDCTMLLKIGTLL
jgi:hypothetical protein